MHFTDSSMVSCSMFSINANICCCWFPLVFFFVFWTIVIRIRFMVLMVSVFLLLFFSFLNSLFLFSLLCDTFYSKRIQLDSFFGRISHFKYLIYIVARAKSIVTYIYFNVEFHPCFVNDGCVRIVENYWLKLMGYCFYFRQQFAVIQFKLGFYFLERGGVLYVYEHCLLTVLVLGYSI